jgi:hypothetical protein
MKKYRTNIRRSTKKKKPTGRKKKEPTNASINRKLHLKTEPTTEQEQSTCSKKLTV